MKAAYLWWAERTAREQRLLLVMAALAVGLFLWLALLRPLSAAIEDARLRHHQAATALAEARGRAALVRSAAGDRPTSPRPLDLYVARTAREAGFSEARVEREGEGARIRIPAARAPALFAWLRLVERRGADIRRLSLRANPDRSLSADISVEAGR